MMCYLDIAFCGSEVEEHTCGREFVPDEKYKQWSKGLGLENGPVSYIKYCEEPKEK